MGIFENDMPFKGGFSLNGVSLVRLRKHFYVLILFFTQRMWWHGISEGTKNVSDVGAPKYRL